MSIDIDDHLVPGIRNDPAAIARVLDKASHAKGVILYFHGGLSSEAYMRNELGPELLRTIFRGNNTDGLHPIFVTYDASLVDPDKIRDFLRREITSGFVRRLTDRFGREAPQEEAFSETRSDDARCRAIADSLLLKAGILPQENVLDEGFEEIDDENFEQEVTLRLMERDEEFRQIVEEMMQVAQQGGPEGLLDWRDLYAKARVLGRIVNRFRNGTHHEFVPTITEEFMRQLELFGVVRVGEFVFHHWETVYAHARECWRPGRGGHALLMSLAELRRNRLSAGEPFAVNAMSHSAGSIVICRLLEHLADTTVPSLDKVAMVVPAVNQTTFAECVLERQRTITSLRLYVLKEPVERDDDLVPMIYPASLLYFVSGAAERHGRGDRMLLIARHLDPSRRPYSGTRYQRKLARAGLGSPVPVWRFFADHPETIVYCPGENNDGDGHENTKLPARSPRLAQAVLKFFTGKQVPVSDIVPTAGMPQGA